MEERKAFGGKRAKEVLRGSAVRFAFQPLSRARGLIACEDFEGMLLLAPCRDVHTMGMRTSIDVAFVDARGTVLEAHREVGPFRRLRNRRAVCVIERVACCERPWFRQGQQVRLAGMRGGAGEKGGSR